MARAKRARSAGHALRGRHPPAFKLRSPENVKKVTLFCRLTFDRSKKKVRTALGGISATSGEHPNRKTNLKLCNSIKSALLCRFDSRVL